MNLDIDAISVVDSTSLGVIVSIQTEDDIVKHYFKRAGCEIKRPRRGGALETWRRGGRAPGARCAVCRRPAPLGRKAGGGKVQAWWHDKGGAPKEPRPWYCPRCGRLEVEQLAQKGGGLVFLGLLALVRLPGAVLVVVAA